MFIHSALAPGTAVEIRRPAPPAAQFTSEWGVVIHSALTWVVGYFPDGASQPANPGDPASIRVVPFADVIACRALVDCEPAWVIRTWSHLVQAGSGLLQAPQVIRVWELAARLAQHRLDANVANLITRHQLESWAGRALTDDDIERLDEAIPHSSIPEAIGTIIEGMDSRDTP